MVIMSRGLYQESKIEERGGGAMSITGEGDKDFWRGKILQPFI